jgi:hypothetical protein
MMSGSGSSAPPRRRIGGRQRPSQPLPRGARAGAPRIRVFGSAVPIFRISRFIEFLSGASEYRVGRFAKSRLAEMPLLVTIRMIEIQFPRKSHSLPPIALRRQLAENAIATSRDLG